MELEIVATIAKVTLKVKEEDGVFVRKCVMAFDAELDDTLAHALGAGAKRALPSLRSSEMEQVVIETDGILAKGLLVAGSETCEVPRLRGTKATLKAVDDGAPSARIEWECIYIDEVWMFLGRNCGLMARLSFTPAQLEIPATAAPKGKPTPSHFA